MNKKITSNYIADCFGLTHNEILKKIRKREVGLPELYVNSRNRTYTRYVLTIQEAVSLILSIENNKASYFTDSLLECWEAGFNIEESFNLLISEIGAVDNKKRVFTTYIAIGFNTKLFKIGRTSRSVEARVAGIQGNSGEFVEIYATISKDIEKQLHKRFENQKTHSEWFDLSEEDIYHIYRENQRFFQYENTIEDMLFDLSHQIEDSIEFTLEDITKDNKTIQNLRIVKKILSEGIQNEEHYKTIFEKCKQALENFAIALNIKGLK